MYAGGADMGKVMRRAGMRGHIQSCARMSDTDVPPTDAPEPVHETDRSALPIARRLARAVDRARVG